MGEGRVYHGDQLLHGKGLGPRKGTGLYSKCERTTSLRSSKSLGNPQRAEEGLTAWGLHLRVGSYTDTGSYGD